MPEEVDSQQILHFSKRG